jgi:hypothetical protein
MSSENSKLQNKWHDYKQKSNKSNKIWGYPFWNFLDEPVTKGVIKILINYSVISTRVFINLQILNGLLI